MAIDDMTRDEKLQFHITREAAEILALSLGEIDKYDTCEAILPPGQSREIRKNKFYYSHLGKFFGKQTKTIQNKWWKQLKPIEVHGKQLTESHALIK